jgi:hypothetical protein
MKRFLLTSAKALPCKDIIQNSFLFSEGCSSLSSSGLLQGDELNNQKMLGSAGHMRQKSTVVLSPPKITIEKT